MNPERWTAVDDYVDTMLVQPDRALTLALADSAAAGLPAISVTPSQGKLLWTLARLTGARRILEIGTLGGYSAIWLGRALSPGGRMITLEIDDRHAAVARANLARADLTGRVEVRVGRALELLPGIAREGLAPFDFFFIDADKPSNADYVRWALELSRPGSVIVVDNVIREGHVIDADSDNEAVRGTRLLYDTLAAEPRLTATAIQTVGAKGYDGMAVALVVA